MASPDETIPEPDVQTGIDYWASQPASYDGVLGALTIPTTSVSRLCDTAHRWLWGGGEYSFFDVCQIS